jgi:hypothetical protein
VRQKPVEKRSLLLTVSRLATAKGTTSSPVSRALRPRPCCHRIDSVKKTCEPGEVEQRQQLAHRTSDGAAGPAGGQAPRRAVPGGHLTRPAPRPRAGSRPGRSSSTTASLWRVPRPAGSAAGAGSRRGGRCRPVEAVGLPLLAAGQQPDRGGQSHGSNEHVDQEYPGQPSAIPAAWMNTHRSAGRSRCKPHTPPR